MSSRTCFSNRPGRALGISVVELVVSLAVLSIIATTGVPAFSNFIQSNRISESSFDVLGTINLARTEAVKRRTRVVLCRSADPSASTPSCGGSANKWTTGWLIFVAAVLLVLVGAPLFLGIGVAALGAVTLIQDFSGLLVARDMFDAVKKEELLAIPFFVLAGNIMTQGSIAERLVGVARAFMGRTPGGLGLASVFACVIFAAISGSSPEAIFSRRWAH